VSLISASRARDVALDVLALDLEIVEGISQSHLASDLISDWRHHHLYQMALAHPPMRLLLPQQSQWNAAKLLVICRRLYLRCRYIT
jgi:hypothetical protein